MGSPFSKAPKTTSFVVNTESTVSQLRSELFPGGVYPEDAWDRLVAALDQDLSEIRSVCSMYMHTINNYRSICNFPLFNRSKGSSIIPEVGYHEIEANGGRFTEANAELIRKRGCVIVRGMLPKDEAGELQSELMEYLSTNNVNVKHVDASPIKDVFWSKAQVNEYYLQGFINIGRFGMIFCTNAIFCYKSSDEDEGTFSDVDYSEGTPGSLEYQSRRRSGSFHPTLLHRSAQGQGAEERDQLAGTH